MIDIKNLDKVYNRKNKQLQVHAINNTSISFDNTGLVCILGESGSGKTTLMNVIGGLETFDKGQITIDEKTLKKYSAAAYEQFRINKFAYIFQNFVLMEDHTVEYNIRVALEPFDMSVEESDQRITETLEDLNILNLRNMYASNLSGGQKQRVAIARALVKRPDVIFADEPTGNLDEENTIKIMGIMKEVSKHCLVMLVTHDKELAEYYADRIVTVHDGMIVSDEANEGTKGLTLHNDINIYLKDYSCQELSSSNVEVKVYGQPEKKLTLSIVWKNGRYYIDRAAEEAETVVLDEHTQIKMLDEHMEDNLKPAQQNINFNKIVSATKKFPFKMIWEIAKMLSGGRGVKKKLMGVVCVIDALILVGVIVICMTAYNPDKTNIITADSHYVGVDIEIDTNYVVANDINIYQCIDDSFKDYYGQIYIDLKKGYSPNKGVVTSPENIIFYGNIYSQVRLMNDIYEDFDFVSTEFLDEDSIICGEKNNDFDGMVIDKWVADKIINSESIVFGEYNSYEDLIGRKVTCGKGSQIFTITGISDTGEPSVYIDRTCMFYVAEWTNNVEYDKSSLLDEISNLVEAGEDPRDTLDSQYKDLIKECIYTSMHFNMYTEDKEQLYSELKQIKKDLRANGLYVTYACDADEQLNEYTATYMGVAKTFLLVAVLAAAMSLVIMYFLIKSNIISQKGIMVVYQVNGIRRKHLVTAYSLQMAKLAAGTFIPTTVIVSVGIKVVVLLKLIKANIVYTWSGMFAIIIAFMIVAVLLTALEVYIIVCKPISKQGLVR